MLFYAKRGLKMRFSDRKKPKNAGKRLFKAEIRQKTRSLSQNLLKSAFSYSKRLKNALDWLKNAQK